MSRYDELEKLKESMRKVNFSKSDKELISPIQELEISKEAKPKSVKRIVRKEE